MGVRIRPKLRVLPNGVKDTPTIKNVSDDRIIAQAEITAMITIGTNVDYANIPTSVFNNFIPIVNSVVGRIKLSNITEVDVSIYDNVSNIGKCFVFSTPQRIGVIFAKGTTLTQARNALNGVVLNYQLATPKNILSDRIY